MQLLEEIKAIKSGKKELRNFGITMGAVLSLIAVLMLWREKDNYIYLLAIALFFFVGGFVFRLLFKPIYYVWMSFAVILGWVMTRVVLCIVFYLALTPISFLSRLVGKKFLDISSSSESDSYWKKREPSTFEREKYENQY
ncbi:MAG: SxtJ family membrane protein [Candidatus Scalinduaceae bacterium]